ncbi:hypothetical protein EV401DRAFT_655071 [Pisolithus croceorrhizus]|nr:hypothetical protein EV401DRAFT_655071 [Pisolithus croceorrhizus]
MVTGQLERKTQTVRRNLRLIHHARRGDQDIQARTKNKQSPVKQSAGNKHPSENHTRDVVDSEINHELSKARYRALDLADLMFGHLVTTSLARDILERFLVDGVVTCRKHQSKESHRPESDEARHALEAAYADAVAHACHRTDAPLEETKEPKAKYQWHWPQFPGAPIDENKLVAFLNNIADKALSTAKSINGDDSLKPRNRFAAPRDKHHAIPLSYEPDGEDMRPDFMVLPLAAFSDDIEPKTDEAYVNFTAMLLAGESKSGRNAREGLMQVQRYIRGIKRAQPWLRFATGMTMGRDFVALLRGDCSGMERVELSLSDGRGCIEFIRIVLGIILSEKEDFGHNLDIEIGERDVSVDVLEASSTDFTHASTNLMTTASQSAIRPAFSESASRLETSSNPSRSASSHLSSAHQFPETSSAASDGCSTSTGSKRGRSQLDDPDDETNRDRNIGGKKSKRRKRTVKLRAFIPVRVHGRKCMGILFTSGSIRGRGTTVYVVAETDDGKTYLALKTSWQDVARTDDQAAVLKKLVDNKPHPNVVIPSKLFEAEGGKAESTLGSIRALLDDDMRQLKVENRILTVSISELKRPVAYFWSPHDFVRGLVGALLGHEYLCRIGVLHRDISENNIVLPLCRDHLGNELGALIDFDMAIIGCPNMHEDSVPPSAEKDVEELLSLADQPSSPLPENDEPHRAQRTGTTPYMSIGVLRGQSHTHYDDIESFLYVLVLFFFSYAGPLEEESLRRARVQGFVQPVAAGRLPHVTAWPAMFERWANGTFKEISDRKYSDLGPASHASFIKDCFPHIRTRWASDSQRSMEPRVIGKLILDCWIMFSRQNRRVEHGQFIKVLREWLAKYASVEDKCYVYPFDG